MEQAFRSLKDIDLRVQPIRYRMEDHVHAHFFLRMLTYSVERHLWKAMGELLCDDTETRMEALALGFRGASQGMTFTMDSERTQWHKESLPSSRRTQYPTTLD